MSTDLRSATTLLLLRDADTASGMEVFMLQRHRRSGFLPNAWVFPGGRVDPDDATLTHPNVRGGEQALRALQQPRTQGLATLIAGVRETFEEAGIWLGERPPPASSRAPLNRGEVSLHELLDAHGSLIDLDQMVPWSWWITPEAEPRRYDTRFLLARTHETGIHDNIETTDSRWICPQEAIHLGQDGFPMAPPTWWTLVDLTRHASVDALFSAAPTRPARPILPIMTFDETGMELILPGHPAHAEPPLADLPYSIRAIKRRWEGYREGRKCAP